MSRLWQIFVAPGDGSDALPIDRSPWYSGRTVTLPKEHWEVILQFAASINKQAAQKLTSYARSENYFDDDNIHVSREELDSILVFMEKLSQKIEQAAPLVPQPNDDTPEDFENAEHARMVKAVAAVFSEARRLHRPFKAWVE